MPERMEDWVGTTEVVEDEITAWPIAALNATFDRQLGDVDVGHPLPPMWHWLFFLSTTSRSGLGGDGHARRGGFLPPIELPRRMFAGGRTEFYAPLRVGERARRTGTITAVEEKEGRSGRLVFVTARYEVAGEGGVALVEEQDLVYREAAIGPQHPEPGDGPIPDAPWSATVTPDEVLLFRFSALTFNGHRIHYDRPYVIEVEGYPGLIVHGPMTALLLLELCRDHDPRPVSRFAFRGRSPLFCPGDVHLRGNPSADRTASLEAWSHDARLAMTAEVSFG